MRNKHATLAVIFFAMILVGDFIARTETVELPILEDESTQQQRPLGWCGTGVLEVVDMPAGLHPLPQPIRPFPGPIGNERTVIQEFPLKQTKVDATVSGTVSRVQVTQVFANPYDVTIEAVYKFPLPHKAAVTGLQMQVGERIIRGRIDRREEARRLYDKARHNGHVAALLEQERPNIFTQSVANILPGSEIEIRITYTELLESKDGSWEFAFPMVVGPRFMPPGSQPSPVLPAHYGPKPAPPRASADLNPRFLPPSVRSGHDIELSLTLDAGVRLDNLRSPTHAFTRAVDRGGRVRIGLHPADTIPNKDFVVRWDVAASEPEAAVLTHHDGQQGYVSVVVHPKRLLAPHEVTPKEMVFVLDCSGSMSGEPMAAAKALARHALLDMGPRDSFQIIRFSNGASGFARTPVAATPENVRRGLAYLERLSGSGGTHMVEGIKAALDFPADPDRLRIVMFLTDGYIGNENEILAAVRQKVRDARLYSFGVGSSVNRFLLEEMAREGRGQVEYQRPGSDIKQGVERFYARIRHPYMTDVRIEWRGVRVLDVHPASTPDLFAGQPLRIHGRYEQGGQGVLRIRGRIAGRHWEKTVAVELPEHRTGNPAIGALWARTRIADLERSIRGTEKSHVVEAITQLGLAHHLVTRWTSFVAVEEQLVVSNGRPVRVDVPVEMPQGVRWEGVFGGEERGPRVRLTNAKHGQASAVSRSVALPASPSRGMGTAEATREAHAKSVQVLPIDEKDALGCLAFRTVSIGLTATAPTVTPAGTVKLQIVFTNHGTVAVAIPAASASWRELGIRIVGASWQELPGAPRSEPVGSTFSLAPGATVVREVEVVLSSLQQPLDVGSELHFILDGRLWGGKSELRASVRVRAS